MSLARRIAVLGDGGWGTTLSIYLARRKYSVILWGAFADYVRQVERLRENHKFLPGIRIPARVRLTSSLEEALEQARLVILAVPSQYLRRVLQQAKPFLRRDSALLSATKGLETRTLCRMSQVIHQECGDFPLAALSGPNIAWEIARGYPATAVVASRSPSFGARIQKLLMSQQLRLYTSRDLIGVELGGALKNPLAIAAGISDGLGFGSNAKSALITRGVVEMARLGAALGAHPQTFWGLSGLGDLITTCLSGRNHWLGRQLGQGRSLKAALASTPMVVEGVETSRAAVALGRREKIELPIIEQVHAVLFARRAPKQAIAALMRRQGKSEGVS